MPSIHSVNTPARIVKDMRHTTAPWVEGVARLGFAAKGLVYVLTGTLAARAAIGLSGGRVTDAHGTLATIPTLPMGRILLGLIAVGLFGYALWRGIAAIVDPEHRGTKPKAIGKRALDFAKALIHIGLALGAIRVLRGAGAHEGGASAKSWSAELLTHPGGVVILAAIGAALVVYALGQVHRAWKGEFLKKLDLGTTRLRTWVERTGRAGLLARSAVFALIGAFVIRAATHGNASEVRGPGAALRSVDDTFGVWALVAIAIGLGAYGVFEIFEAWFRRIRAE